MSGRPTKLNQQLQGKIVKLLKTGATVADTCQHIGIHRDTFYDWLKRGEAGEPKYSEFSDAVTRAFAAAKVTAIGALRNAMTPYTQKARTVETLTETKLTRKGEPYEYTKRHESETVTTFAGDWRAAVEYLKRRFPDEWSEKRILELGLSDALLKRIEDVAKQAAIPASELFENMINAIADQLQHSSAESAGASEADGG